jgi:hypothetical protein
MALNRNMALIGVSRLDQGGPKRVRRVSDASTDAAPRQEPQLGQEPP